jgi:hypothetical protein
MHDPAMPNPIPMASAEARRKVRGIRPPKPAFTPAKTVSEAEAKLLALGLVRVSLTDTQSAGSETQRMAMGNNAAEAIAWTNTLGAGTPSQLILESAYFVKAGNHRAPAVYVPVPNQHAAYNRAIVLNPTSKAWNDVAQHVKDGYDQGWYSTDDAGHLVYHEVGHHQLAMDNREIFDDSAHKWQKAFLKERKRLVGKVSGRALAGHKEFVSEIFAQLVAGKELVDSLVVRAYKKYGGREI